MWKYKLYSNLNGMWFIILIISFGNFLIYLSFLNECIIIMYNWCYKLIQYIIVNDNIIKYQIGDV